MENDAELRWTLSRPDELDACAMHDLLKLRVDVFVVEQTCAYPEIDGRDTLAGTRHLVGRDARGEIVACGRDLVDERDAGSPARIGRIAVAVPWRGRGVARTLMRRLLADLDARSPERDVVLGAQLTAERLYASFGFVRDSEEYLEDGIPHVDMRLTRR